MFSLGDGSMMKITVARWFTPHDKNIDQEGILPDIFSDIEKEDIEKKFDRQKNTAEEVMKQMLEGKNHNEIISNFKK